MRPTWFRVVRPLVLSLVILSCATENAVGPTLIVPEAKFTFGVNSTSNVVISQVYGGGGNGGATYKNDFIELFNRSTDTVSIEGWSVQYASAAGTSWQKTSLTGKIGPGRYRLVQEAAGAGGTTALPSPDFAGSIAMSATAGKVALVKNSTGLTCGTAANPCTSPDIADLVGFGGASFFEGGAPTGATANATAALRKDAGCTDTDENGLDFAIGGPSPRNKDSEKKDCGAPVGVAAITVRISWVSPGTSFRVTASSVDDKGQPVSPTLAWSIDPQSIATVDPESGEATGKSLGVATITATAPNGVSGSAPLFVVNPGDIASISITIDAVPTPAGFTKPAFATSRTTTGATPATDLTWTTSDASVATVSELGYLAGVGPGSTKVRATAPNGVYGEATFTVAPAEAATTANYLNHLEFGVPVDGNSADDYLIRRKQYALSYNKNRGGPNWVSWDLNASHFGPSGNRCECFSSDQSLPADFYHVVDFDYRNGGYDRGHMAQSDSRSTTVQENASTFLLTQILPQANNNNTGPWLDFENYVDTLAIRDSKEVYLIAGGLYSSAPATLKGEGKVAIPDYTWKIAVVMPAGKGVGDVHSPADLEVLAVKMPNLVPAGGPASAANIKSKPWTDFKTTVDELERETGYDFLSNLPDQIEILVEANDRAPVAAWDPPATTAEGTAINFDGGASSDPDADALTYNWNFGDGTSAEGVKVSHSFSDNGPYTVTLTVRDPAGAESTLAHSLDISNVAPTASFSTGGPVVEGSALVVGLSDATDPSNADVSAGFKYRFDCGDGFGDWTSSNTGSCSTVDNPGFNVRAEIRDKDNGVSSYDGFGSVTNAKPSVLIATPSPIYSGEMFSLAAGFGDLGQQDSPWNFTINWGNGTESGSTSTQGAIVRSITYSVAGSYTLSVAVTDKDGGTGTATANLRVLRLPTGLGVNPAQINTKNNGNGQVVVTVFGSSSFGGDLIDIGSVRINGARPDLRGNGDAKSSIEDRNGDGIADLVVHFERSALLSSGALTAGATELVLEANLTDGRQIEARGSVNIATRE